MSNKFGFSVWPWMRQEGVIRRLTKDQAIQEYAGKVLVFDVANNTFGRPTESGPLRPHERASIEDSILDLGLMWVAYLNLGAKVVCILDPKMADAGAFRWRRRPAAVLYRAPR